MFLKIKNKFESGDYKELSHSEYEFLVGEKEKGVGEATNMIGYLYETGHIVERNPSQALQHYRKASEQGFAIASHNVATMLFKSIEYQVEPERDVAELQQEAMELWVLAYEQGYLAAAAELFRGSLDGFFPKRENTDPLERLKFGAQKNDDECCYLLGSCYLTGESVAVDFLEAEKWFKIASDLQHAYASYNLGTMYYNGQIRHPSSKKMALHYFELSAKCGYLKGMETTAEMYSIETNLGVERNLEKGLYYLNLALSKESPRGWYIKAVLLASGLGFKQNVKLAKHYCKKATLEGEKDAERLLAKLR